MPGRRKLEQNNMLDEPHEAIVSAESTRDLIPFAKKLPRMY